MARVAVAMSGGVDSSVAAALMVEAGHDVVGLTMNLWPSWVPEDRDDAFSTCCGIGAIDDARHVAQTLGIRHYVLNLREEFEHRVIRTFASEYAKGRTPNPCVACNRAIKFSLLLQRVDALGLAVLATGHYARIQRDGDRVRLLRGADRTKDQSYVLFALRQAQLRRLMLPVGELTKEETRAKARALGLAVADKPDSQEICFVPQGHYSEVVARFEPAAMTPGQIIDADGAEVGRHEGIGRFTIGQRRGLGLATGRPLYVTGIDPARNAIVVGGEEDLLVAAITVDELSWTESAPAVPSLPVTARVRHAAGDVPVVVTLAAGARADVRFERPQRAVSPGQAVCFYDGDLVLGGGIIAAARTVAAERAEVRKGESMGQGAKEVDQRWQSAAIS
ncbi:MAG: tRNA 2-thiouridine(34) synthase MnmA [Armatimonadetes bacterium]|nr:tRNA 2-thiouridine(34) synthase MnmA [Armatimonadota bacterium]